MNTMTATAELIRESQSTTWTSVCEASDLIPDTGVCALVNKQQIAIFYSGRLNEYFAIGNYDPVGEANVLSRGILGSIGDPVVVASPLYQQHFKMVIHEFLAKPDNDVP